MTYRGESDPVFLRIEVVKAAIAWQDELFNALCRKVHFLHDDFTIPVAWVETIRISDQIVNEAIEELLTTAPTSLQGVAAILLNRFGDRWGLPQPAWVFLNRFYLRSTESLWMPTAAFVR
jgi:hypothetical protein